MALPSLSVNRLRSPLTYILTPIILYFLLKFARHIRYNYQVRTNPEFKKIPSLPRHWLVGNVVNAGKHLDPGLARHPDYGMEEIWNKLGRPPCFWLDFSPVDITVLVVADPALAEMVSEPRPGLKYSLPKSDTTLSLGRLLGLESMVLVHGEEWRTLRRRFNKGFAPAHLHTLAPLILEKTKTFVNRLKTAAEKGTTFELCEYAQDLTTDIITMVCIERDFGAQTCPEGQGEKSFFGIFTTSRKLSAQAFKVGQGFNALQYFDPVRPILSWMNETALNWKLYNIIKEQISQNSFPSDSSKTTSNKPARSIINLATADLDPTPALIKNTVSQIKTFLFAGQDTTATLIQWLCFELAKCQNIQPHDPMYTHYKTLHKALLDEHNSVFGKNGNSDPFSALALLGNDSTSGDDSEALLTSQLPVSNAWVKEALRLHPPASSARMSLPAPYTDTNPPFEIDVPGGDKAVINGLRVYNCQWLLQRHPEIWGSKGMKKGTANGNLTKGGEKEVEGEVAGGDPYAATLFNPHRWLDSEYMAQIPTGAFRPFERGPRNCVCLFYPLPLTKQWC